MTKAKLYKIDKKRDNKSDILSFIVGLVVYAVVLMLVSYLFSNFYIKSFTHALIAALILSILNYTIKPILIYWTLPLNIVTFGISYPIVNMIILQLCDLLMGKSFVLTGIITTFFVAIFISALKLLLDRIITSRFGGN